MTAQLYRHYGTDGELLYVGISLSAINRLIQHSKGATWFPTIAKVEVEKFEDRKSAVEAEVRAIREEHPLFNRKHTLKGGGSVPATSSMTPKQYKDSCQKLGISIYGSAKALAISLPQAQRYAAGKADIPEKVAKLLRALIALGTTEV